MSPDIHRMCTGKRRYATTADARDVIQRQGVAAVRRAYECPLCGGAHITSKGVRPDPAMLANQDAVQAVRSLLAQGFSPAQMAARSGLTEKRVMRAIAEIREATP